MRYAIWYDNSSGFLEPFKVLEAPGAEDAVDALRALETMWFELVVTHASDHDNGFGNDPNWDAALIVFRSAAFKIAPEGNDV